MCRKFMLAILIFGSLFLGTVNAEIKIFTGEGVYYMESDNNETLAQVQEKAKLSAELHIIEQAGVYISGNSLLKGDKLTEDDIESITAGIMNVTDVKYSIEQAFDNVIVLKAVVTAEIDMDKIPELLELEIQRHQDYQD